MKFTPAGNATADSAVPPVTGQTSASGRDKTAENDVQDARVRRPAKSSQLGSYEPQLPYERDLDRYRHGVRS